MPNVLDLCRDIGLTPPLLLRVIHRDGTASEWRTPEDIRHPQPQVNHETNPQAHQSHPRRQGRL